MSPVLEALNKGNVLVICGEEMTKIVYKGSEKSVDVPEVGILEKDVPKEVPNDIAKKVANNPFISIVRERKVRIPKVPREVKESG